MCVYVCVYCATGLPEQAVSVTAAAALSASQPLNGSTSLPQHAHTRQLPESRREAISEDREWTRERQQDTEEAEEISDIMSDRQLSVKER